VAGARARPEGPPKYIETAAEQKRKTALATVNAVDLSSTYSAKAVRRSALKIRSSILATGDDINLTSSQCDPQHDEVTLPFESMMSMSSSSASLIDV